MREPALEAGPTIAQLSPPVTLKSPAPIFRWAEVMLKKLFVHGSSSEAAELAVYECRAWPMSAVVIAVSATLA